MTHPTECRHCGEPFFDREDWSTHECAGMTERELKGLYERGMAWYRSLPQAVQHQIDSELPWLKPTWPPPVYPGPYADSPGADKPGNGIPGTDTPGISAYNIPSAAHRRQPDDQLASGTPDGTPDGTPGISAAAAE